MPVARSSASEPVGMRGHRLGLFVLAEGHHGPLAELLLHGGQHALERPHLVCNLLEHRGVSFMLLGRCRRHRSRGGGERAPVEHPQADGLGHVRRAHRGRRRRGRRSFARPAAPCRTPGGETQALDGAATASRALVAAQRRDPLEVAQARSAALRRRAHLAPGDTVRAGCIGRALPARGPTRSLSPPVRAWSAATSTGGSTTCTSMRSSSGPLTFAR